METKQTETRESNGMTFAELSGATSSHPAESQPMTEAPQMDFAETSIPASGEQDAPPVPNAPETLAGDSQPAPSADGQAGELTAAASTPASELASPPVADGRVAAEAPAHAGEPATAPGSAVPFSLAKFAERVEALAKEVQDNPNKVYFLGRVRRLLADAQRQTEEGVAAISAQLQALESMILEQVEQRRRAKEAIVARAEELSLSTAWKTTSEAFRALVDEWKAIGPAGRDLDDPLWNRFQAAREAFNQRRNQYFEERQQQWAANRVKKEELVARAEALADSQDWRATAEALRALQAEWKTVGSAGRAADEELWSRFRSAQDRFFEQRAAVFEENRQRKEALCVRAEELSTSTDWRETTEAMKALQAEWKTIGPCGKEADEALWQRFRAATQSFFERRAAAFQDRDREEQENLRRKEELCAAAEALTYAADPVAATEEAKILQAEWKTIGPVRRDRAEALWQRFRAACDKIFENAAVERARRRTAWEQKLHDALARKREQLYRLRESISLDESAIARWEIALAHPRPTESPDVLQSRIAEVSQRIKEKRERVEELEASIRDIQSKLAR